ncbi:MAG: Modification methylase MjaV [Candidatus Methanolliviera sp. GoM_oil]|nr:MAG: Modification methylase MjaV [Candidatus Methanolliviera sp. GoM_oil]
MIESIVTEIQNNTYKPIEINIDRELTSQEIDIISDLENIFPKSDFYFIKNRVSLIFNLREIDLSFFQNKLNKLMNTYQINGSDNIFTQLLDHIKNIKSYGLKGNKRLYVDYNKERKVKNRKAKEAERGVYYYAQDHNFSKKNNELPEEFINQVICGDSAEILKKLPDNCVDLVFTSPPYNFGLDYENHKDGTDWNEYFDKIFAVFKECIRIVKFGGRIIVNVQPLFSDYIPIHHIISNFFMKNKMIWRGEILWEKNNYNCKYTAWGSWKSPSNPYMKYTWEFLEIFCKGDLKHKGDSNKADITGDEFKKWVYAKWSIAPERNMKEYDHPAMFPEKLVEQILKLFSFENDVIFDPFNGVGTTTKVAKQFNRKFIGIDISEEYTKKAKDRLKNVDHQRTLK